MPDRRFDIAIHGSGPVATALAVALQDGPLRVGLIARRPQAGIQGMSRPIALSHASRLILERLGAWEALSTTPIKEIHVSQAGSFGRTRITRDDLELPALGYVATYAGICAALDGRLDSNRLSTEVTPEGAQAPTRALLTVHAEGVSAGSTRKDYGHSAIVTLVTCDRAAHGTAWERFTEQGPLALLPLDTRYAVVWSRTKASAAALMRADDAVFTAELQAAFGRRAGHFLEIGARECTPLVLRRRETRARAGEVFIGNAAQTLHPVAGQGLNLGLRDAWELACLVRQTPTETISTAQFAGQFSRARMLDACASIRGTDLLATLYTRRDPLAALLRSAALTAFDILPVARRTLARRMIYGASAW